MAMPRAQRIDVLLERLSGSGKQIPGLSRLVSDYGALLALYRRAASGQPGASSARSISAAQQQTAASATALHVSVCAPIAPAS
jgi:hypothetical protein